MERVSKSGSREPYQKLFSEKDQPRISGQFAGDQHITNFFFRLMHFWGFE